MFAFHRRCDEMVRLLADHLGQAREDHSALLQAHQSLIEENRELKFELEALKKSIQPVSFYPGPLHMTEDEEDATAAFESGQIDKQLYEDILREVGADNTEIQFDE